MKKLLLAAALTLLLAPPLAAATQPAKKPVATKSTAKPAAKPKTAKPAAKPVAAPEPEPEPLPDTPEVQAMRSAFQFAFPVYEMMRTRANAVKAAEAAGTTIVNNFIARTTLADASTREVTTPNNDTLYASAWLDLSGGPVVLTMPALPKRYHSAALMDLFTDNTSVLGTRADGGKGGNVLIAGPAWRGQGPEGVPIVRAGTNDTWLLVRVVVHGPDDLVNAADAIKQFELKPGAGDTAISSPKEVPVARPDARLFLAVVNEALGRGPLPPADAQRMLRYADWGIVPGEVDAFDKLPPEKQELWTKAMPALRAELRAGLAAVPPVDGWSYSPANAGAFGDDDASRASTALGGLAALPRQEAMYMTARTDKAGEPLDGAKAAYYVRLPGKLPVGGFWSLTAYQREPDGRLYFYDTPTKRYALTDRTKFLHYDRDGSVEVFLQPEKPFGERAVNWLPIPKGPFVLVFRAYLPGEPLTSGKLKLPPVETAEPIPATEPKEPM